VAELLIYLAELLIIWQSCSFIFLAVLLMSLAETLLYMAQLRAAPGRHSCFCNKLQEKLLPLVKLLLQLTELILQMIMV
jgi:hypothetical protein